MKREEILYQDFSSQMIPRMLWHSGTAGTVWINREKPVKTKYRPTEAEDNAEGRAHRRRQNKCNRGWLPYAKR